MNVSLFLFLIKISSGIDVKKKKKRTHSALVPSHLSNDLFICLKGKCS